MRRKSVVTKIALGSTVLGAGVLGVAVTPTDAVARLDLYVDKSTQQMSVTHNGALLYVWPVSTGRDRHSTPSGVYTPERLERSWFSKAYYNAPMPHAIFFHNGYAIHGSYDISKLGGPASHGCVRLHPRDAALLFSMVQRAGPNNTAIFIGGDSRRLSLRYGDVSGRARPAYRLDSGVVRHAYPPDAPVVPRPRPGTDRYVDGAGGYPAASPSPSGPRMSPYYPAPPVVDGRGDYPTGPAAPRYHEPGGYSDGRVAPRNPRVEPYGDTGRYVDERGAPRGSRLPPDYRADPQPDGRVASHDPRVPSDYSADPYYDAHSVPYGRGVPPDYPADRHADGRGVYPQPESSPRPPYDTVNRYADGPARQRSDQLTMRGNYLPSRPPALRPYGDVEGASYRGARPTAAGAAGTKPKLETRTEPRTEATSAPRTAPKPGRLTDAPSGRNVIAGEASRAPALPAAPMPQPAVAGAPAPAATAEAPQERPQPDIGYRVLPPSYWAGASWRWRMKRDEDGFPRDPQ
jgi:hypothetical protein